MTAISEQLRVVRERIARATAQAGRAADSVCLIAVSKTKPASAIRDAYAAGQRHFGENYVQELVSKTEELSDLPDLVFHFIGHLQRNKAKLAVKTARVVHTVDSPRLAEELGKRALELAERGGTSRLGVLVEVNVGGEAEKSGSTPDALGEVLAAVERETALELRGLMTVPPFTEDPRGARPFFDALARLRDAHGGVARLPELSMGMTHDLEEAIASGATLVRVGTAIFGGRG